MSITFAMHRMLIILSWQNLKSVCNQSIVPLRTDLYLIIPRTLCVQRVKEVNLNSSYIYILTNVFCKVWSIYKKNTVSSEGIRWQVVVCLNLSRFCMLCLLFSAANLYYFSQDNRWKCCTFHPQPQAFEISRCTG